MTIRNLNCWNCWNLKGYSNYYYYLNLIEKKTNCYYYLSYYLMKKTNCLNWMTTDYSKMSYWNWSYSMKNSKIKNYCYY